MEAYKVFTATKSTSLGFESWLNQIYKDGYEIIAVVPAGEENRYRVVAKRRES